MPQRSKGEQPRVICPSDCRFTMDTAARMLTVSGSAAAQMQSEADKRRNEKQRELEAISGQATASQPQTADSTISPTEQSQLDREANYVEAADKVGTKMATDPASVTKEDGDLLHSRETKAFGATEKGGIASQAHSLASENTGEKKPRSEDTTLTPAEQSKFSRKANYVEAADKVGAKIATDPASVTKEDGDLLRSRETKAFGATEKGGLASQAQSLASENAGEKK